MTVRFVVENCCAVVHATVSGWNRHNEKSTGKVWGFVCLLQRTIEKPFPGWRPISDSSACKGHHTLFRNFPRWRCWSGDLWSSCKTEPKAICIEQQISVAHERKTSRCMLFLSLCERSGFNATYFPVEVGRRGCVAFSLSPVVFSNCAFLLTGQKLSKMNDPK